MAPKLAVFDKKLKYTDTNHRLSFPVKHLDILPPFPHDHNSVEFRVSCGEQDYTFRCIKRKKGPYCKPVIERGWSDVVRDKGFMPGDRLKFYMEACGHEHEVPRYRIEVLRWVSRADEIGTAWFWQQIA